jgi:hypothetical protein
VPANSNVGCVWAAVTFARVISRIDCVYVIFERPKDAERFADWRNLKRTKRYQEHTAAMEERGQLRPAQS